MPAARRPARGFSLIELMITVALIAILLVMALPSFGNSARVARERSAVQKLAQDFAWARGAAGADDASTLNGALSGVPVIVMKIAADCTWTTTINGTTDAAHSMTSTTLAGLAPGAACTGVTLALPATLTFQPQGFVSPSGSFTFTGASAQAFPMQILYSGSLIRTTAAS